MKVRSFQLADYVTVTHLLEKVLPEACYDETMEAFARQLSWDSELVLVAEKEQSIVGIIIGTIDNNKGYFYRVAVHADHQRQGIGKTLIETMKQRFVHRNVSRIFVAGDIHNKTFLPVYESVGYRATDYSRAEQRLRITSGY
ncbi:GNAT family N-acetyltransferase [Paenibacillus psychroresistens]|nr:GNAT family N-acetyltransferase [Paenibacillus psychroresistens]